VIGSPAGEYLVAFSSNCINAFLASSRPTRAAGSPLGNCTEIERRLNSVLHSFLAASMISSNRMRLQIEFHACIELRSLCHLTNQPVQAVGLLSMRRIVSPEVCDS